MRVIGVIDLAGGVAVHARHGDRARYLPVASVASRTIGGDPLALARTYVDELGLTELYVADLDAIGAAAPAGSPRGAASPADRPRGQLAGQPAHGNHDTLIARLATVAPLWLDAAVSTPGHARRATSLGATTVIVGLETLDSFDALSAICAALGQDRVALSLDLRGGVPVAPGLSAPDLEPAEQLAARAVDAGVGTLVVLDLARVGASTGPDVTLMARVRAAAPATTLVAGGGIRGVEDLSRLADAGCDGALVATALHNGRLGTEDLRRLRHTSDSL